MTSDGSYIVKDRFGRRFWTDGKMRVPADEIVTPTASMRRETQRRAADDAAARKSGLWDWSAIR